MPNTIPERYNLECRFDNLYWESVEVYDDIVSAARAASYLVEYESCPEEDLRILDPQDKEC